MVYIHKLNLKITFFFVKLHHDVYIVLNRHVYGDIGVYLI